MISQDNFHMKVSIVTPSYHQGRFIERTLQSVASQEGADVEVEHLVCDGGSTDGTVDILRNFSPPVRWVSERDEGQTHAINKGIRAASGEIIGWLNSDDIYYPGAIARVVDYFTAHPAVDIAYGMADHIDVEDKAFEAYPTEPWNFTRLQETCYICQPALFFRRRIVEVHGFLDESLDYCMDYEYWLRLGKAGVLFGYMEEKLAGSRLYADNKTLGAQMKVHKEINDMFGRLFGKVPDQWLFNYAHAVVRGKKVDRTRHPRLFVALLAASAIVSALWWNGYVSKNMGYRLFEWCRMGLMRAIPI